MFPRRSILLFLLLLLVVSCGRRTVDAGDADERARWFRLEEECLVVVSPFDGSEDTLRLDKPFERLVCMSTSHVGCLAQIGAREVVKGVSGLSYVSDSAVRSQAVDVGYDAAPDYEGILSLHPDLLVAYSVSAAEPRYLQVLRSMGVRVLLLHDHLENHPLARAEYVRLFGALTGRREHADSAFSAVREAYHKVMERAAEECRVIVNIPYGDQWFIPGGANYMTRLIGDAGGVVLGAEPGNAESSVISVETAWKLSRDADVWLHPGWCRTRKDLLSAHPLFADFPVFQKRIYNNNRRQEAGGGNDFWESGAARPDLVLEDLVRIFRGEEGPFHYYLEVQ